MMRSSSFRPSALQCSSDSCWRPSPLSSSAFPPSSASACRSSSSSAGPFSPRSSGLSAHTSRGRALETRSRRSPVQSRSPSFLPPPRAAAPAVVAAATSVLLHTPWGPLSDLAAAALGQLLLSAGAFVLSLAAATFLLASIPTLWAMGRTASRVEKVLRVVEEELPQSAALLRLSGLEVCEAITEVSRLGSDLSGGVRSVATMATDVEKGIKQGASLAEQAVTHGLKPAASKAERAAREVLEATLVERASLTHTREVLHRLGSAAEETVRTIRKARFGLQLASLAALGGVALRRTMEEAAEANLEARAR